MADAKVLGAPAEQDKETQLPEAFLKKMKMLLGEGEYAEFLDSFRRERLQGLRLNPLKVRSPKERQKIAEEFELKKVPWAKDGYYYDGKKRPGRHAWHEAGVFYIQEPSAMIAAELLDAKPGEKILDLCGAPGGKTTQIAGQLLGRGLLVSNEIHPARAKILSQNVERMGIANGVVTNEDAAALARRFPRFFDGIVVDAPCSGEGMFRKDEEARRQWSPQNVMMCAKRQEEILDQAAVMVRPGGRMVYSTCTFSPEENEGSICGFLRRNPEFHIEKVSGRERFGQGIPQWVENGPNELEYAVRIWPHRQEGEGHFAAVLRKGGADEEDGQQKPERFACVKDKQVKDLWREFCMDTFTDKGRELFDGQAQERMALFGKQLYLIPEFMPDYARLRILRAGLHLGTLKKNRFEPSHSLALYLRREYVKNWQSWAADGREMEAYLRGETLKALQDKENGWALMLADGYSIGWAKQSGGVLKNHYPKGLRHGGQ